MGKQIKGRPKINIPQEIIEEILYNLPVKSLLRFKCVSKPWRSLISSKYFIKQHLNRSIRNEENTAYFTHRNKLMFSFKYYPTNFTGLGSLSLRNELIIPPNFDNHPLGKSSSSSFLVEGSCNGLILISIDKSSKLLLWNPSTREVYKTIPPPSFASFAFANEGAQDQFNLFSLLVSSNFLYGFGYDELRDEYKVLCVNNSYPAFYDKDPYRTQMYSSKTNSWKKIENIEMGFPVYRPAKFVNGRFHWLAPALRDNSISGTFRIVSLHLFEETYETVAPPPRGCLNYHGFLGLEELGGYLSLVVITQLGYRNVSVWAMMEYGKIESWTKVCTLSDFVVDPMNRITGGGMPVPLCLKKNGDIAVAFGSHIVVYNGKTELHRSQVSKLDAIVDFTVYLESLVSPFGDP